MCTVITLQRPGHAWPLLLAANRDERIDRAWDPPAEYWPEHPGIVAGRDRLGGGTWMGINADGVVATVLNRPGSLGPADGKRSRGELPLMALTHSTSDAAAAAITQLQGIDYRTFNMVIADRSAVWFVRNLGTGHPTAEKLAPGLHMMTSHDPDDLSSPRVARHLPRFLTATPPKPPDWSPWVELLGDSAGPPDAALSVPPSSGFATVSASLLGIPQNGQATWSFASGPAQSTAFKPVAIFGVSIENSAR